MSIQTEIKGVNFLAYVDKTSWGVPISFDYISLPQLRPSISFKLLCFNLDVSWALKTDDNDPK